VKNICVCVERRHEYKQKSNYGETILFTNRIDCC